MIVDFARVRIVARIGVVVREHAAGRDVAGVVRALVAVAARHGRPDARAGPVAVIVARAGVRVGAGVRGVDGIHASRGVIARIVRAQVGVGARDLRPGARAERADVAVRARVGIVARVIIVGVVAIVRGHAHALAEVVGAHVGVVPRAVCGRPSDARAAGAHVVHRAAVAVRVARVVVVHVVARVRVVPGAHAGVVRAQVGVVARHHRAHAAGAAGARVVLRAAVAVRVARIAVVQQAAHARRDVAMRCRAGVVQIIEAVGVGRAAVAAGRIVRAEAEPDVRGFARVLRVVAFATIEAEQRVAVIGGGRVVASDTTRVAVAHLVAVAVRRAAQAGRRGRRVEVADAFGAALRVGVADA